MTTEQTRGQPETRPSEVRSDALLDCPFCGAPARELKLAAPPRLVSCTSHDHCAIGQLAVRLELWQRRQSNDEHEPRADKKS